MNPEREIKKILKEFVYANDNLILTERLFVAISVLNWALAKTKDQIMLDHYLNQVKKHIKGEITLYWEDGIVKIHRGKK